AEQRDRDRRGVRGEDDLGLDDDVDAAEDRALGVGVLDDRLDDVVGADEIVDRGRGGESAEHTVPVGRGELAFLDELAKALVYCAARAIEHRLRDVHEPDGEARLRERLRNAVAHRARADDADRLDHVRPIARLKPSRYEDTELAKLTKVVSLRVFVGPSHALDGEGDAVAATEAQRRDAAC